MNTTPATIETTVSTRETITRVNGNGNKYTTDLPMIVIASVFNDVALKHIEENTGLVFTPHHMGMQAQPETSNQIATLLMTYDFKSRYYNNWNFKNTLILKPDYHVGWQVDSICYSCCKANNIPTGNMKSTDRLSC